MRAACAVFAIALACAAPAAAEAFSFTIDPARSAVRFTLQATLHEVAGEGRVIDGAIRFEPEGGVAEGVVRVDARSFRTGNDTRDANMHEQVLESERFPEIRFTAERLELRERTAFTAEVVLHGNVAIHGAEHPIAVPGTVARNEGGLRVTGRFTVPYVEWGLRDVSTFVLRVGKEVRVELELQGKLALLDSSRDAQ